VTLPGFTIEVHSISFDHTNMIVTYVAAFHARHTGDGGAVPPTNKAMHTDYVYAVKLTANGEVKKVKNFWNDAHAMKQVGWM
jgi:hypothetical protein